MAMVRPKTTAKVSKRLSSIGITDKKKKDRYAKMAYNKAYNELERIRKQTQPLHPTFNLPVRKEDVYKKMRYDLKKMQEESSLTSGMSTAEILALKENATDRYTPYTKGRVTESTANMFLFNRVDLDKFSDKDIAVLWAAIPQARKEDVVKYSELSKYELELLRTKFLNSEHVSPQMKEYLRKSDLQAIEEFRAFIKVARKRAGIYAEVDYDMLTSDYYEEVSNAQMSSTKKDLLNFVKFQMEMNDIERANKIYDRAKKLKYNRKSVFTTEELGEYL